MRKAAKTAKVSLGERFLPPFGSPALATVLKPADDDAPDRAIVIDDKGKEHVADKARRSGAVARAAAERTMQ